MIGRPRRRHVIDSSGRLTRAERRPANTSPAKPRQLNTNIVTHQEKRPDNRPLFVRFPWLKYGLISGGSILLGLIVWALVASLVTYAKVTDKNSTKKSPVLRFLGDVQPGQLQGEGDGRVNVLLVGIGGAKHPGGNLADTIMVASLDPKNKEAALLSIPRDLYVPVYGNGYSKINAAHAYGEQNAKKTGGGPAVLKKTLAPILDLPIHYYIRLDFAALQKIVDTLGGVTVEVEKPIVDLSYPADNMIDYSPFRLAAGVQNLDGKTALRYARSRHAAGSEGSDFARARRQQKLLEAVKQKGTSLGVLGNPKKLNDLIAILGDHIKTDITLGEAERFYELWKDIDSSKMVTKVLDNGLDGPLVSHSGDERGSILLPRSGDYSEIQQIAHEIFTDPYLRQEKAKISFINATGNLQTGKQVMKMLTSYGYEVVDSTAKDQSTQRAVLLVDQTGEKPYTTKFLESRFQTRATLRRQSNAAFDLVLTIGTDYKPPTAKPTQLKSAVSPRVSPSGSPKLSPTASPKSTVTGSP